MFAVDFSNPLLWRRLQATGPAGCPASEPGGAGNVRCADYRANGVVGEMYRMRADEAEQPPYNPRQRTLASVLRNARAPRSTSSGPRPWYAAIWGERRAGEVLVTSRRHAAGLAGVAGGAESHLADGLGVGLRRLGYGPALAGPRPGRHRAWRIGRSHCARARCSASVWGWFASCPLTHVCLCRHRTRPRRREEARGG